MTASRTPAGIRTVRHEDLGRDELDALRALFDREYLASFGPWDPDRPYGYSPADVHVLAVDGDTLVGHVGFQRRTVDVGDTTVLIGGTGGVLVSDAARGLGLGNVLMRHALEAMRGSDPVDFGYLGCREEVVPFYASCGWRRVHVRETCVSWIDGTTLVSDSGPVMIRPATRPFEAWPAGDVDLRGTPW